MGKSHEDSYGWFILGYPPMTQGKPRKPGDRGDHGMILYWMDTMGYHGIADSQGH